MSQKIDIDAVETCRLLKKTEFISWHVDPPLLTSFFPKQIVTYFWHAARIKSPVTCLLNQSVANIFFWPEYEYEYIRNVRFNTNTNTNIFRIIFWTEYEYEYIRNTKVDRIRIFKYFWLEYSNIIIVEYTNIPWTTAIGFKFCIFRAMSN